MLIRGITEADIRQVTVMNEASVPAVSPADETEISRLVSLSELALAVVAEDAPEQVLAFCLLMTPGVDYRSENYRWFEARGTNFLYVDRIVVAEGARDRGIGEVLYRTVFEAARNQGRDEVTCEVNVDPPNPGSLRFHARLGFAEVGRQATKGDTVTVALLAAPLAAEKT